MKTYKDIDDFIKEAFPFEFEKIIKQNKTVIEKNIEEADAIFTRELEEAIKGEKADHEG